MRHPALLPSLGPPRRGSQAEICMRLSCHAFIPMLSHPFRIYAPLLLCCILSYHYKIISSPRRRPEAVLLEYVSCARAADHWTKEEYYSLFNPQASGAAYTRILCRIFLLINPSPRLFSSSLLSIHFSCINKTASAL